MAQPRLPVAEPYYTVRLPHPETHYFLVEFGFEVLEPGWPSFTLRLPAWTPGSYLIRDFARQIVAFSATDQDGARLPMAKTGKDSWQITPSADARRIQVNLTVYAYELTVRTSHLDASHGFFNGANLLPYLVGGKHLGAHLNVEPPNGWLVHTALDPRDDTGRHFWAPDYDALIDAPVETGPTPALHFEVRGVDHALVIWNNHSWDAATLAQDLARLIEGTANLFPGPLPYSRYLFVVHCSDGGWGGLEHQNSATVAIPPWGGKDPETYRKVLSLFSHEYFHLWNVKRLHPHELGPFDYQTENYTPLLWVLEGWTDYYAWLNLCRSGLVAPKACLEQWANIQAALEERPGTGVQSLAEASWDAWIKYYRPDANSPNATVSYYQKGALAALYLDLSIRLATDGAHSLDSLLAKLWQRYHDRGYPESAVLQTLRDIVGDDSARSLWTLLADTPGLPPLDAVLTPFGIRLRRGFSTPQKELQPDLGLATENREGRVYAKWVRARGPAEIAGLSPGDEIIGVAGVRVSTEHHPGWLLASGVALAEGSVTILAARQGALFETTLEPSEAKPDKLWWEPDETAKSPQQARWRAWLEQPWEPQASESPRRNQARIGSQ